MSIAATPIGMLFLITRTERVNPILPVAADTYVGFIIILSVGWLIELRYQGLHTGVNPFETKLNLGLFEIGSILSLAQSILNFVKGLAF